MLLVAERRLSFLILSICIFASASSSSLSPAYSPNRDNNYQLLLSPTRPMSDSKAQLVLKSPTKSIKMDMVTMFGDSITQGAWSTDGLGAALANAYQRKLDVMNRGLSGYNTAWALPVMKSWLPRATELDRGDPTIRLMLIWFGANDAATPPSPQGMTVEEFKMNLHIMINLVLDPTSPFHSPSTKLLLLTPPPCDASVRNYELETRDPPRFGDRDDERTRLFAEATKEVAAEAGVLSVDIWSAIMNAAAEDGGLVKYLSDGLHLTADGYRVVTQAVATTISTRLPELHWDNLDEVFPNWRALIPEELQF